VVALGLPGDTQFDRWSLPLVIVFRKLLPGAGAGRAARACWTKAAGGQDRRDCLSSSSGRVRFSIHQSIKGPAFGADRIGFAKVTRD